MIRRGWCPSLHEPMASGDGLLVRVKPRGATLSADDAAFLADAATRFGNGAIELTSRANLQFRGLTEASAMEFARAVVERGLGAAHPAAERRRNIVASPLAGIDPGVAEGTGEMAAAMSAMLEGDATLAGLPAKFGVVVDGGGVLPVSGAQGDILLQLAHGRVLVSLAGSAIAASVAPSAAVAATRRLILAFLRMAPDGRMRDLAAGPVFAQAGLLPDAHRLHLAAPDPVGDHGHAFGFGLAFGQMPTPTMRALARLAARHGDGSLRIGPWRCVLLPGITPATARGALGVITDPADPALHVAACAGMPACPHATVDTRADAMWLARSGAIMSGAFIGRRVHVSGCDKGCAHPAPAAVTLVGDAGRYRLIRNGRADATSGGPAITLAEAAEQMASA